MRGARAASTRMPKPPQHRSAEHHAHKISEHELEAERLHRLGHHGLARAHTLKANKHRSLKLVAEGDRDADLFQYYAEKNQREARGEQHAHHTEKHAEALRKAEEHQREHTHLRQKADEARWRHLDDAHADQLEADAQRHELDQKRWEHAAHHHAHRVQALEADDDPTKQLHKAHALMHEAHEKSADLRRQALDHPEDAHKYEKQAEAHDWHAQGVQHHIDGLEAHSDASMHNAHAAVHEANHFETSDEADRLHGMAHRAEARRLLADDEEEAAAHADARDAALRARDAHRDGDPEAEKLTKTARAKHAAAWAGKKTLKLVAAAATHALPAAGGGAWVAGANGVGSLKPGDAVSGLRGLGLGVMGGLSSIGGGGGVDIAQSDSSGVAFPFSSSTGSQRGGGGGDNSNDDASAGKRRVQFAGDVSDDDDDDGQSAPRRGAPRRASSDEFDNLLAAGSEGA